MIVIAVVVIASVFYLYSRNKNISEFGLEIPADKLFLDAPSAAQCETFDIVFTYDDSAAPIWSGDGRHQRIIWSLDVTNKSGAQVKDFYCTLVLDDWIVHNMQYAMPHLGIPKDMAADVPAETPGFHSTLDKFIDADLTSSPEYQEHINAPVKFLLAFDGRKEYYMVTPEFRVYEAPAK